MDAKAPRRADPVKSYVVAAIAIVVIASTLDACSPSRVTWVDEKGQRIAEYPGAEHCDWQDARVIDFRRHAFVRDPDGIFGSGDLAMPFEAASRLPNDAVDTGYREEERELWRAASTWPDAVFVVSDGRVERWPRLDVGCAKGRRSISSVVGTVLPLSVSGLLTWLRSATMDSIPVRLGAST